MFFRYKTVFLAACLAATFLALTANWNSQRRWSQSLDTSIYQVLKPPHIPLRIDQYEQLLFWESLVNAFNSSDPGIEELESNGKAKVTAFNSLNFSDPDQDPVQHVVMTNEDVAKMKHAHGNFMHVLDTALPRMVYAPGTKGIVVTAGGKYLPLVVITLRMLKRIGSTLPMEVFLETAAEYESHVCEEVLPSLNGRCVILSEFMDPIAHSVDLKTYQLKVFAILFSSFEDILFLDADAWPTVDPSPLFQTEPFLSTGLVTWPDFWAITPSDFFYVISESKPPRMLSRASSETGEMLISKSRHEKSLLLAAYYNYFGPKVYYRLFSQGAPGEGDKETFLTAANVLKEPYYAVSEPVTAIGHIIDEDAGWSGSAMVQFDPREDYALTSVGKYRVMGDKSAPRPKPLFVHINFPKFNPGTIYDNVRVTKLKGGGMRRAWDIPQQLQDDFGVDIERRFWEEAEWVACKLESKFRNWYRLKGTCEKARTYYEKVFGKVKMSDHREK